MSNFDFLKNEKITKQRMNSNEKRRGPDTLVRLGFILAVLSWTVFVALFIFIMKSAPQDENFFSRFHNVRMRSVWDTRLLTYSYYSAIILFFTSMLNLAIFKFRSKRKSDKVNKFIVFSILASLFSMCFYFLKITHVI